MKKSVYDCGTPSHQRKGKARCTAVGEPENAMKRRKALLSEEELLGHTKLLVSAPPPFLEVQDYNDIHGFGGHDLETVPHAVKKL